VGGHLEVEGRRSLANSSRGVVVGAVAGAIVAAPVAGVRDGHTTQMRAHSDDHQPFGLDHALLKGKEKSNISKVVIIYRSIKEGIDLSSLNSRSHSIAPTSSVSGSRSVDVATPRSVSISAAVR